jgi:hypothetical protein
VLGYGAVADSAGVKFDTVVGFDFDKADTFNLPVNVSGIDKAITKGKLALATFNDDLSTAIGTGALKAHHAVLFTASSGGQKGETFLVVDANDHAGYQVGEDFVFHLQNAQHLASLNTADFV